jgi:hypothetical protein
MADLTLDELYETYIGSAEEQKVLAPEAVGPAYTIGAGRRVGAFHLQRFRTSGVQSLRDFAEQVAAAATSVGSAFRQVDVLFKDLQGGAPIQRTVTLAAPGLKLGRAVTPGDVDLVEAELAKLSAGTPLHGSDAVDDSHYSLDVEHFRVGYVPAPAGGAFDGISKRPGRNHPHFKLRDFTPKLVGDEKTNDCLFAVLRAVAKENKRPVPRARNATIRAELNIPPGPIAANDHFMELLGEKFGLRVRVVTGMECLPDHERVFDDDATRPAGRNRCLSVPRLSVIAEGGPANAPPCDVYLADNHYEYLERVLEPLRVCPATGDLLQGVAEYTVAQRRDRVIAQGRNWHGADGTPLIVGKKQKKAYEEEMVIVYDYETTYDESGELVPYALGFLAFDPRRPFSPDSPHDFSGAAGHVEISCRQFDDRFSVSAPLLDLLARAPEGRRYTLVSFNGVRFDHFLLAAAAHARGHHLDVFATQTGLRSLRIGRHFTVDLAKLLPGMSLAAACESFKTAPTKLAGFSHVVPQQAYERGEFAAWFNTNRASVVEYLAADVLSSASLFMRLKAALGEVTGAKIYGNGCAQTIGGIAWDEMVKKCALPAPVAAHAMDNRIRDAVVGGRVQVYRAPGAPKAPVVVNSGPLRMFDVVSLYPTSMAAEPRVAELFADDERWGWYPSGKANGEPQEVKDYTPGDVGVFEVTVHSQPWPNVLPKREKDQPLDWEYQGEFETQATHIDIAMIRRGGGRVTVHSGLVWPVCRPGLFRPYIAHLIAKKNEQDEYKKDGDPRYNPALREVYKLLMNAASGKCCQANYDDMVVLATGSHNQHAAERKMDPDRPRIWIPLGGETCIIMGKKVDTKIYKRTAKPSILAVLIYAYSRAFVWRTLCQHGILYSDTDSGLMRPEDGERLRKVFPSLDPTGRAKQLGDFEEELGEHGRAEAYLVAPKDYAVFLLDEKSDQLTKKSKLRVKGVNQRTDRLIHPEHVLAVKGLTTAQYTTEYNNPESQLMRPLRELAVAREFFKDRAAGKIVHVLTSQLTRTFKDDERPFSLRQKFLVKQL